MPRISPEARSPDPGPRSPHRRRLVRPPAPGTGSPRRRGLARSPVPGPRSPLHTGFTLLEVLAAIALLAIAFAIAITALGRAAHNARSAAALDTAVEHAQSLLAEQGLATPLQDGTHSGKFSDGMAWTLKVHALSRPSPAANDVDEAPTPDAAPRTGGMLFAQAGAVALYRLDVAVHYGDGRTLRLSTERAQAAPEAGP